MFRTVLDMFIFSSLTVKLRLLQSAEKQVWSITQHNIAAAKLNQRSFFNLYAILQQLW